MSSRWRGFGRCGECGVDAGAACRNVDDEPVIQPCAGRAVVQRRGRRPLPIGGPVATTGGPAGLPAFNAAVGDARAIDLIARLVRRPVDGLREHAEILEAIRVVIDERRKP